MRSWPSATTSAPPRSGSLRPSAATVREVPIARIVLVRHGATEWNESRRAQGHADIELNDLGHRQAIATAEELMHLPVTAVWSSDMARAVDTARPIAEAHGLEVAIDPRFREIDQGDWEGLTTDEIKRRWPELWGPARHYTARPNGESPQQVRARALDGLKAVVEVAPGETVVVVSHGGTIRWISASVLGYDDIQSARIRGLGNGASVSFDATLENGQLLFTNFSRQDGNTPDLDDPND